MKNRHHLSDAKRKRRCRPFKLSIQEPCSAIALQSWASLRSITECRECQGQTGRNDGKDRKDHIPADIQGGIPGDRQAGRPADTDCDRPAAGPTADGGGHNMRWRRQGRLGSYLRQGRPRWRASSTFYYLRDGIFCQLAFWQRHVAYSMPFLHNAGATWVS